VVAPGRVGRIVPAPEELPAGSRYASPTGGGSGLSIDSPTTLSLAIADATPGAVVVILPGSYTGIGAISKTLTIRPPLSNSGFSVVQSSGTIYPDRGTFGSLTLDGVKVTSLLGTAGGTEYWTSLTPSQVPTFEPKMGVLFMHGATANELQPVLSWPFAIGNITRTLAQAGYSVLSIYGGGDTWGNAACMSLMSDGVEYLKSHLGAKAGKVALIGGSMGGLAVANWARANPSQVAAIVGLTPVSDVTDIHTNNRALLASSINGAYSGGWSEAVYGATRNPHTYAGTDLVGLAYKAWYGASDTTVIPSTVTDVATAIGGTASAVSVTGNHTTALSNIPPEDVLAFLNANGT